DHRLRFDGERHACLGDSRPEAREHAEDHDEEHDAAVQLSPGASRLGERDAQKGGVLPCPAGHDAVLSCVRTATLVAASAAARAVEYSARITASSGASSMARSRTDPWFSA